ncbi:MAG: hypothetical protein JSV76_07995, partial [Candidatus Bathyarchaeota archaeon]
SSEYHIIMSLAEPNSTIHPVKEKNVTIYPWLHNRFEILKACDVVVSRAGLGTISQAISYGKPLVLIPTPSHTEQVNNAKRTEALKLGITLDQRELNFETLHNRIKEVLTDSHQQRAVEVQKEVSKYDAVKTMINTISQRSKKRM